MAFNNYGKSGRRYNSTRRRKRYTKAEQIAFELGQKRRVTESINSNKPSRVHDAFCKGYQGMPSKNKTPLF